MFCYELVTSAKNYEIMLKLPWKRKIWGTHLPAPLINMERLKKNGCKVKIRLFGAIQQQFCKCKLMEVCPVQ